MNAKERIEAFHRNNAPFYIVDHDNGRFSLCLGLNDDYGQSAFNRYAELIGEPVSEQGLYTHGSGYEWETVFRKAFEADPRLSQISFDCEACGFFCYANDLTLLMKFGQRFRNLCEDQERFSELVCTALSGKELADMNNGIVAVNTPSEEYTEEDGFGEMKL